MGKNEHGETHDKIGILDELATLSANLSTMGELMAAVSIYGAAPSIPEPERVLLLAGEWLRQASEETSQIADAVDALPTR